MLETVLDAERVNLPHCSLTHLLIFSKLLWHKRNKHSILVTETPVNLKPLQTTLSLIIF